MCRKFKSVSWTGLRIGPQFSWHRCQIKDQEERIQEQESEAKSGCSESAYGEGDVQCTSQQQVRDS